MTRVDTPRERARNMEGEFTCPECGKTVKAPPPGGPGRQARCEFCGRLLEVPFLPRAEIGAKRGWRRSPRWVPWAWWGVSIVAACLVAYGGVQIVVRGERAGRVRLIEGLIAESKAGEAEGRISLALAKLDQALELLPAVDYRIAEDPTAIRERRRTLALQDAKNALEDLRSRGGSKETLGPWMTLAARSGADPDLAPLRQEVESQFQAAIRSWIDREEAAAKSEADAGRPLAALERGASVVEAAAQLPVADQAKALERIDSMIVPLIERWGAAIDFPVDEGGADSGWYREEAKSEIVQALEAKGYLPASRASRWDDVWDRAPYRLSLAVQETLAATYLDSQNRLTRVEAHLTLTHQGREIWKTSPSARTNVPAPGMSSFAASRLALSSGRSPEVEALLRDDARQRIIPRIQTALRSLPEASG